MKKWIFPANHLLFSVICRENWEKMGYFGKKWIFWAKSGYFWKNGYFEKVDIFGKMNIEAKLPLNY